MCPRKAEPRLWRLGDCWRLFLRLELRQEGRGKTNMAFHREFSRVTDIFLFLVQACAAFSSCLWRLPPLQDEDRSFEGRPFLAAGYSNTTTTASSILCSRKSLQPQGRSRIDPEDARKDGLFFLILIIFPDRTGNNYILAKYIS